MNGSGNVITEKRDVSGYHGVALSGIGDLTINQNGSEGLVIEGEDNVVPHIKTEVRGGTLHIEPERTLRDIRISKPIRFTLSAKSLNSVEISGAGSVEVSHLDADDLSVGLSGAGGLQVGSLKTRSLNLNVSGSGRVSLAGTASSQQIDISGSGDYRAPDLASSKAMVRISGAGSAVVRVSERIDAEISGVGSVAYIGSPAVNKAVSGIGSVRKLSEG